MRGTGTQEKNIFVKEHDFEVISDGITPSQAAELADVTISQNQAIEILGDLGVSIPTQINDSERLGQVLDGLSNFGETAPLSPEQIKEFVRRAKELSQ